MTSIIEKTKALPVSGRVVALRERMLGQARVVSVEQARIITRAYREHAGESVILKRAWALRDAMAHMEIAIEEGELVVGNRTKQSCAGVVFPEGGLKWLENEIDMLGTRPQDKFQVPDEVRQVFFDELVPFWRGKTLEDEIERSLDPEIARLEVVGKLNQKDHAQGHICPDVAGWLHSGPAGLKALAEEKLNSAQGDARDYYQATAIVLGGACDFYQRYADLAASLAGTARDEGARDGYQKVARVCHNLARRPARTFHEAVQALWMLFVLLQLESNASSFSPGRADQYLYPYFAQDIASGQETLDSAQELIDMLFIKFNQIVYLRNTKGAAYFAGFPIGFNITLGGRDQDGNDAVNDLTYLLLNGQAHVKLRQPNLSARIHEGSSDQYVRRVAEVIGMGTGMPQVFGDEAVVRALEGAGYAPRDAINFAVVGCVELSVPGKALGFSDAAMFNMVKALELTLNDGKCMLTGAQLGLQLGDLTTFDTYEALETAYARQLDFFVDKMEQGLKVIEVAHQQLLPSPLLSSVVDDCLDKGMDVTRGGAHYNLSGIQLIQVANVSDSLAALKQLVYGEGRVDRATLLDQLKQNFPDEVLRQVMLTCAPKYGNDVAWVDQIGEQWVEHIKARLDGYTNYRGGRYTIGLYTVSSHVPMGEHVAATPDGRRAGQPLADGGLSAVYGRDQSGPTALMQSVARIRSSNAANGTLLNMKFAPALFQTQAGVDKFVDLLRGFVKLRINHAQFNVVRREDLIAARKHPENYRNLLVRVAGYTANYVDLDPRLQDEIIARTEYGC